MIKSLCNSYSCRWFRRSLQALWLALPLCQPVAAVAGAIYQWTDSAGLAHFSDSAPPPAARNPHEIETPPLPARRAQGLRPGERARLQTIERRQQHRQHRVQQARRREADAAAEHRRDCRERRARQRSAGSHALRKAGATYLRRHCW